MLHPARQTLTTTFAVVKLRTLVSSFGVVVLTAAACGEGDESVFNAEVGECVESISDLAGTVSELPETECNEDHEGEVFFLVEHEGGDDEFPGTSEVESEAREICEGEEFEDYTGVTFEETAIGVVLITPTEESWSEGDRESICVLTIGEDVDVSFEDNGEDFPLGGAAGGDGGGGEQDLSALIDACEGGDNAACDELYAATPVGSEEERIGSTCGGRSEEELFGSCVETLGE